MLICATIDDGLLFFRLVDIGGEKMARLKTQPNLRQEFRELIVRANYLDIEAKLARGWLYWTDEISQPTEVQEYKLWADEKALRQFREAIKFAENIAAERDEIVASLEKSQALFEKAGIKIEILNSWWLHYETEQDDGYLPLLESSRHDLLERVVSATKNLPSA